MASLYPKKVAGKTYWYLREMAWVNGKPKMKSERYLGSAADIAAAVTDAERAVAPQRTRHLAFGDVAAVWGITRRLGLADIIDEVVGPRRADAGASVGTYLALAALNRIVDPCSRWAFADWWATTAGERFTKIRAGVLQHRRFFDALHTLTETHLIEIERRVTHTMIERFGLDVSAVALDMTNFATYIDTANDKADLAQRGKAKQKRADLRLVGLGLVVTRDGGIPLVSHTYPATGPTSPSSPPFWTNCACATAPSSLTAPWARSPWSSTPGRTPPRTSNICVPPASATSPRCHHRITPT